jgi:hypothetical protein
VRPAGVDSKTKTDRADGNGKDIDKVRRFVAARNSPGQGGSPQLDGPIVLYHAH